MLNLFQIPFFISSMLMLRSKCLSGEVNGFGTGGILWFTDLTTSDPTFILPILQLSSQILFMNVNMNQKSQLSAMKSVQTVLKAMMVFGFPV